MARRALECSDYLYIEETEELEPFDGCCHGKGWDEICVECCPEDDDGSYTGDEWS